MDTNTKQDGGPAFPTEVGFGGSHQDCYQTGPTTAHFYGMTLRDYMAAKAMEGRVGVEGWFSSRLSADAEECYKIADAMLDARKPEPAPCAICGGSPDNSMHGSKYHGSEVDNQHEYEGGAK